MAMKTYIKPEFAVEALFSAVTVAADPVDFTGGMGNEVELSANDWWDIIG